VRFFGRSKWDPRAVLDIIRLAREWRIDLLHVNGKKAHLLGRIAGLWAHIPTIIHLHFEYRPRPLWLTRWLARRTTLALAVSERLREHALRAFKMEPDRARALYSGSNVNRFRAKGDEVRGAVRAAQGIADAEPVILVPGRITDDPDKGQRVALRAFAHLREVRPDALMWIAGDGPAREDCERLARELGIEDRVRFLGQRRDLPELLAASDLVMIPSFCNDAFPYTAVEAMCAGRPVVASRDGGLDEMLAGGTRGLLVSPRDAEGFAEASLRLIHDPLFATGLAKEGSAFASELTVERHVGALTRIYEELLGSSS
jgi:glycosyltransferase involved in cell wall biosynthesis